MRRLPIYFLLDVSESMVGEPLASLEEGMGRIVSSLQKDPSALESVFISVIAFAGKAEVISPLREIESFYTPRLPIGGGTELGMGLDVLMSEIDREVIPQSRTQKGDWKPIVFLITDGEPTSPANSAVERWLREYSTKATMVAITLGYGGDYELLSKLTPNVLVYEGSSDEDFRSFVDWISASLKTQSQKIEHHQKNSDIELSKSNSSLSKYNKKYFTFDNNSVILTGRCQKTKRAYLIKYIKKVTVPLLQKYDKENKYQLDGCFTVSEDYFKWTKDNMFEDINVSLLEGAPSCPHCGNMFGLASCSCGRIMCISDEGLAICPWCGAKNDFIYTGSNDFNIQRGQG